MRLMSCVKIAGEQRDSFLALEVSLEPETLELGQAVSKLKWLFLAVDRIASTAKKDQCKLSGTISGCVTADG